MCKSIKIVTQKNVLYLGLFPTLVWIEFYGIHT